MFFQDFLPVYREKTDCMYLCYEKYDTQQAVEIGLSARVMCRVLVIGSRRRIVLLTSHLT